MKTITILLVEDHTMVREGFRKLLESEEDFEIVGEAGNGRAAVGMTKKLRPTVIVMDIAMPQLNGLEATRQILRANPAARVLILSAHSDDAYIDHLNGVGVAGFLSKQTSSHVLAKAVREVAKGNTFFSRSMNKRQQPHLRGQSGQEHV